MRRSDGAGPARHDVSATRAEWGKAPSVTIGGREVRAWLEIFPERRRIETLATCLLV